ncbi:MAG: hypothetical protein Ta2B_28290 [Termitinemataceae bacterium]|nr:MAG: hypothetical protein Ta2B_28290 [Termitinemataceae bacterium]
MNDKTSVNGAIDDIDGDIRDDLLQDASDENNVNVEDNIAEAHKFRAEKVLKRLLIICSILLGAEMLWMFLITPCLPLSSVDIKTIDGLSRGTVLAYSGINSRSSYMSLDAEEIERRLSVLPLVESAQVMKHFPDSLSIILKARHPTAMSLALIDGLSVPVFFDRYGVIFKIGKPEENVIPDNVPILSGLIFENIRPGTRLPSYLVPLLENIQVLREKAPQLLPAISEIHINKKPYDGIDLLLYPASYRVKIRMTGDLREENLRYMLLLLDVIKKEGLMPDEIDFRTGTASYIFR